METSPSVVPAPYDLSSPFLFSSGGTRLIEIQPTLRCNLKCTHCYSESGRGRTDEIPLSRMAGFMTRARELGYSYVGVSGGEPLLWNDLVPFLKFARGLGFSTAITTNGTLLTADAAALLKPWTDLIAVSVDGPPEEHAVLRGPSAFAAMHRGLGVLREVGLVFSLAFTLTRYNAHRVKWLYEFAEQEGAMGLHVHPLCNYGAARSMSAAVPDDLEFKAAAWLLALLAQERGGGGPAITLDAIRLGILKEACWPLLAKDGPVQTAPFSDLVPSLVVEPDGSIVPFIYGFPRSWQIGFVDGEPLGTAAEKWRERHASAVSRLVCSTIAALAVGDDDYLDFFGELLAAAHRVEEAGRRKSGTGAGLD
jgi:MoaA/NifB/PqqE/SkfB family radical SAM enzyme